MGGQTSILIKFLGLTSQICLVSRVCPAHNQSGARTVTQRPIQSESLTLILATTNKLLEFALCPVTYPEHKYC